MRDARSPAHLISNLTIAARGPDMLHSTLPKRLLSALGFIVAVAAIANHAASAQTLVVYNAQHESLAQAWADAFTRDTGIKVALRNGGDSELANQIVLEGAASPADVFLTENSPAMALVEGAGLFAPVAGATLAQVPPQFRPSSGKWVGIAARATVFVYRKGAFAADQLPLSLSDLAKAGWKGRWGASPAGADFQAIVSAYLLLNGEAATLDWLKAMKSNSVAFRGNGNVMRAVNSGQVDAGVIYHYYPFVDQAKTGDNSRNISLHYFKHRDAGAFVSISGGGVLASSKNAEAAQSFLRWITGKAGQEILRTGDSFEYAVGVGAASHPNLTPLSELEPPIVDPTRLNSRKVVELMTAAGLI
jgi:iron(III) transport system substrate-binding protein